MIKRYYKRPLFSVIFFHNKENTKISSAIAKLLIRSKWSEEGCSVEMRLDEYLFYGGYADLGWIVLCLIAPCYVDSILQLLLLQYGF